MLHLAHYPTDKHVFAVRRLPYP